MKDLNRLVNDLYQCKDDQNQYFIPRSKPVRVLTEDGDVFDIVSVEYDPENEVTYLKCQLAG